MGLRFMGCQQALAILRRPSRDRAVRAFHFPGAHRPAFFLELAVVQRICKTLEVLNQAAQFDKSIIFYTMSVKKKSPKSIKATIYVGMLACEI